MLAPLWAKCCISNVQTPTERLRASRKPRAKHTHSQLCFVSNFLALDKSLPPFVPHFPSVPDQFPTAEHFWVVCLKKHYISASYYSLNNVIKDFERKQ